MNFMTTKRNILFVFNIFRFILSYSGNIQRDIYLYSSWFLCFECKHVPRSCNRAADAIAKFAKDSYLISWVNSPPGFLTHILLLDSHFLFNKAIFQFNIYIYIYIYISIYSSFLKLQI